MAEATALIQRKAKCAVWGETQLKSVNWAPTGLWPLTTPIIHPDTNKHPLPLSSSQNPEMNLLSKRLYYLGLWFQVRECIQWDLKPNHLLHSPIPLPNSQRSPFTKQQFLGTLSLRCYLPFGTDGVCLTVCVFLCCMCDWPSVLSGDFLCINVCESML